MVRHGVEQGPALTRRIVPALALVAAFYAVAVPIRLHQHGALWFAHVGRSFLRSAHTSPAIDSLGSWESRDGYDGQFYLFIAADPAHAHDYMQVGHENQSAIRYARIAYPLASRAASAGSTAALPWAMLAVNLAAILAGTAILAGWLVRRGRSAWPAALYGLWPGMVFSVFRDLSEPLAYCLAAAALLVFDPRSARRLAAAAAALALSLLTRETTIAFALGLAFALWLHDRRLRRPVAFLAASVVPMLVWRIAVSVWLGATTIESSGSGWKVVAPFYAMYSRYPWDWQHRVIALTVDLPFLLCAAGALYLLLGRSFVAAAVTLLLNVALFVVFIPQNVTIDWGAAVRNATPALIAALICVPAVRSRLVLGGGAVLLSPLWYLLWTYALGIHGLDFMTK